MDDTGSVGVTGKKKRSPVQRSNTSAKDREDVVIRRKLNRILENRRSFSLDSLHDVKIPRARPVQRKTSVKSQVDLTDSGRMEMAARGMDPFMQELKEKVQLRSKQQYSPPFYHKNGRVALATDKEDTKVHQLQSGRITMAVESPSYNALPIKAYVPEINRHVQSNSRMTVGFIPSSRTNLEPKTFEKCTKISVDGKSTKIGKSESLKVEDNQLLISDEKGNVKILIYDFGKFQEQSSKSAKELVYTHEKSVVKISRENTDVIEKKTILQRLLGMRTPYSTLESRGIAKNEAVFGNTLENISQREKKNVPEFVTKITRLIETPKNITSQGIYRASGNIATIQKIRLKVDLHKLNVLDEHKDDTDVLAGALKLFFRELKDCIIGHEQYNALNDILDKNGINGDVYTSVMDVIKTLSKPRRETLEHLMRHLLRVISYEKENSMSIQNMSICWGPSIICLEIGTSKDDVIATAQKKNSIVELLLRSYKYLFESQLRPSGSQLSLFDHHNSLRRIDSFEETMPTPIKWSSMTALDNCLSEDFVNDVSKRIELHRDANIAYNKMTGSKTAMRIMRKAKQKTSKTLNRLLTKATIDELCMLLKLCYDDHFASLLPQEKFNELREKRDHFKNSTDCDVHEDMYKEIRAVMRKQPLFKQHVPLFAHFHKIINICDDPVSKLHQISVFWYKTICGIDNKGHTDLLMIFDVIDAFKETDWIDLPSSEEDETDEPMLRHSKSAGGALAHISEENLCDEKFVEKRSRCEDVIDCCASKRPVTFTYTKASESDQD